MIGPMLAILLGLNLATSAEPQDGSPERSPPPSQDDVVVVGSRERRPIEHEQASEYIRAVSQTPVSGQYARWHDPICPRVVELDPSVAQMVEDRISRIAIAAGMRVAPKNCRTNLVVMFTLDGDAALKRLEQRRLAFPASVPIAERRTIRQPGQPVRWWTDTELQGSDGEPLSSSPPPGLGSIGMNLNDDVRYSSTYSSSLISTKVRAAIPAAVAIVDVNAAAGRNLASIADYLAFMVLGRARPVVGSGISTIARLFDPSCPTCTTLSPADRAYLKGLYDAPANRPANVIRATLAGRVSTNR